MNSPMIQLIPAIPYYLTEMTDDDFFEKVTREKRSVCTELVLHI